MILLRGELLLIFVLSLLYLFIFFRIKIKKIFLIFLITLITTSPYLIRNVLIFKKITVLETFGYNLWKGNHPVAMESSFVEGSEMMNENLMEKLNAIPKDKVLLVSRLDGPEVSTVYRIIDGALSAEKNGLKGKAYIDARWPMPEGETGSGYQFYDASLHKAAQYIEKRMEVVIDDKESLFKESCCKQAALYCGWYSLSHYIDSFEWQPGSIGYHMASNECSTLKNTESSVWCLKMLQNGISAVIGPVYEPYIQGFPVPELFFAHLVEGYMSLGEAYLVSMPYFSWQMILVGDPLYQPFNPDGEKK